MSSRPSIDVQDITMATTAASTSSTLPPAVVLVEELGERDNILLFATTFSGPSSLYKLLAIRSLRQQIMLRRNLSYVPIRSAVVKNKTKTTMRMTLKKPFSVDDLLPLKEAQALKIHSWSPGRTVRIRLDPLFLPAADDDDHNHNHNHKISQNDDHDDDRDDNTASCHISLYGSASNPSSQRETRLLQKEQLKLPLMMTPPQKNHHNHKNGENDDDDDQSQHLPTLEFTPGSLKQDGIPQSYHLYFAIIVSSPNTEKAFFAELGLFDRSGNILPDGKYTLSLMRVKNPETFETLLDEHPPNSKDQPTIAFHLSSQEIPASLQNKNPFSSNGSSKPFSLLAPKTERETERVQPVPKTICYNFHYLSGQIIQKEIRMDFVCPWCFVNYFELVPLMVHLKNFHPRFKFQCADSSHQDKIQIGVSINKLHSDLDYFVKRRGDEQYVAKDYSFVRQGPPILSGKKRLGKSGTALKVPKAVEHTLYHSQSCTPIRPDEPAWDSGDEIDMNWLKKRTESLIDDFSDVNVGEKDLMKLWNLHVTGYKVIPDRAVSSCCVEFATKFAKEILKLNVRNNFCLHLLHLFNLNLISAQTVRRSLEIIEQAKRDSSVPSASMAADSSLDSTSASLPNPPDA